MDFRACLWGRSLRYCAAQSGREGWTESQELLEATPSLSGPGNPDPPARRTGDDLPFLWAGLQAAWSQPL